MSSYAIASPSAEPDAYSVEEFCRRHSICRATLYNLWRDGAGPRKMKAGGRTLISREAAADWRRQAEAAAEPVSRAA